MPGAWTDLTVATRVGLRALGRRLSGGASAEPDLAAFRRKLDDALASMPEGRVAEHRWVELPATEPPWRDCGLRLNAGDQVSYLAVGRVYASRALDIWIQPKNQIWTKIGGDGEITSSSRNSNTVTATRDAPLLFGNYFPNDWVDRTGARLNDDSVYGSVSGETLILVIRWAGDALAGLKELATASQNDPEVCGEIERLERGPTAPAGWSYLWHLGETELFQDATSGDGRPEIRCAVHHDVGILQKEVSLALTPETELSWEWIVDSLPSSLREDSLPSHDYLSIAVEFENGRDITYYWSGALAPETGFICPLPNWKHKEFHVVVRSGPQGLGEWQKERRNLHADYRHYMGEPPERIVRVWFIAVAIFQRGVGECAYRNIRIGNAEEQLAVL